MKEVTRIIDAKITIIETMTDEEADNVVSSQKDAEQCVKNTLKKQYNSDDVHVEIKDFVRNSEKKEKKEE